MDQKQGAGPDRGPRENADDIKVHRWLCAMTKCAERDPDVISHALMLGCLLPSPLCIITRSALSMGFSMANTEQGWTNVPYDRLYRLDSLSGESHRSRPPTILGMRRFFRVSHTFKDGTHVPAGTYTGMATHAIENDPKHIDFTRGFDDLRYFWLFEARRKADDRTGASAPPLLQPDQDWAEPWLRKSACPGRNSA
ncbi:hypothetical protein F4778DRAFT_517147 [Xylariomycetidae sp. FL2044]|nr:hypothetical protein F4778DRAFT_517147 [Xylariomycetidae sp. FL2044]